MAEEIKYTLTDIQNKLKVPKGQTNDFGGYKYRSAEDILDKVKPLLEEGGCKLVLDNSLIFGPDRTYIDTEAIFRDSFGEITTVHAQAGEDKDKKKMDNSQLSGASISYSRKYALAGLFLLDNTKDADTMPPPDETLSPPTTKRPAATKPHGVPAELEAKLDNKGAKGKRRERFGKWVREVKQCTASYLNKNFDKCWDEFEEYEQHKMKPENIDLPDGADLFN